MYFGPIVPRLTIGQLAYASGGRAEISGEDHTRLMDLWRRERRLAPMEFRSPMERWFRYAVSRETRNGQVLGTIHGE